MGGTQVVQGENSISAPNRSLTLRGTYVSVAQIEHEHVPAERGLPASAPPVTSALGPLQRQRQRGVGLQVVQVLRRSQLHVAVAGELHRDGDLEETVPKNETGRCCSWRQTD